MDRSAARSILTALAARPLFLCAFSWHLFYDLDGLQLHHPRTVLQLIARNHTADEQLLGIAQRTVVAVFDCPPQRFSPRKLIPVNVKKLGKHVRIR